MNIQTERLENHTARLTVEIEPERLEQAKQSAARRLAKRVNIPGFRKGKAPYKILENYLGEAVILEDALEALGSEVYKEALDQSDIQPYTAASLEDFKVEPQPTFTYLVPLQPSVDLGDYRSVRLEFEPPVVEDADVDSVLKSLQEQHALIEESRQPAVLGNRLTVDIHGILVDEAEAEPPHEEAEDEEHEHGDNLFIHRHDLMVRLNEDNEMVPGFSKALEGATADEQREFELTYPDDEEEYEDLAGKRVKFDVTVKKIEIVTLPSLNDDFAARVTAPEELSEAQPKTLLELRMQVREDLQKARDTNAKSEFSNRVLDKMVEQATISYPEAMVVDQINIFLERFDQQLRQQGLTLKDYMRIYHKTSQDLYQENREAAVKAVERILMLREILEAEGIDVSDSRIEEKITEIVAPFGDQAERFRQLFTQSEMREGVKNDLLQEQVLDRIVAIAKGEAPDKSEAPAQVSEEAGTSA